MVDHQFADATLAGLYDVFHPSGPRGDYGLYPPMVMAADAVLDVGCGTGSLLRRARELGHAGRLCGLDPAAGMLAQARTRRDVEWVLGDLAVMAGHDREFDLAVMAGHAFQVLLTDDEISGALTAVRAALVPGGRFAFETRNPLAEAWRHWTPDHVAEITDPSGAVVRMAHQVQTPVESQLVRFTTTYTSPAWPRPAVSHSTLRFLDRPALATFLADAGLTIEAQFGDWDASPVTDTSPEIITIARR